jgi:hypothetical protein
MESGPRRRWENNIQMDLKEIVWEGGGWINVFQDKDPWRALVNMIRKLRVP